MGEESGVYQNQGEGAAHSRVLPVSNPSMYNKGESDNNNNKKKMSAKVLHSIGFEELCSLQVWRASMAEIMGTAILVFMIDTIVISSVETDTKIGNIILSCFIAFVVTILLLAAVPISGGHLNPIITLAAALEGLISFTRGVIYIVAQCIGAVLGALALKAVVSDPISNGFSLGGCTLTAMAQGPNGPMIVGINVGQALALEIFCTFIFLFPVGIAFDHRQLKAIGLVIVLSIIGIVVGLLVFVSTTVTGKKGYSGAGLNPARCVGPALVRGGHLWTDHWVFWVGPALGCLAYYLYSLIIPRQHFKPRVNSG